MRKLTVTSVPGLEADYLCDGVADEVEIEAALNAAAKEGCDVELIGLFNLRMVPEMPPGVTVCGFEPEIRRIWGKRPWVRIRALKGSTYQVATDEVIIIQVDIGDYGWVPGYIPLGVVPILSVPPELQKKFHNGGDSWRCSIRRGNLSVGKHPFEIGLNHHGWLVISRGILDVREEKSGRRYLRVRTATPGPSR